MQYTRMNRSDLRTWDATMWGIIADAQAEGWLFGLSNNGHAIGRSPDGDATISIPRTDKARSGANARAELGRWKTRQARTPSDQRRIDDALAKMDDPLFGFSDEQIARRAEEIIEGFKAQTGGAGTIGSEYLTDAHLVVLRNALGTRECLSRIMQFISAYDRFPDWLGLDIDGKEEDGYVITERTRAWRVQWVFFDAVTQHVVTYGGPNIDEDTAAQYVAELVAMRVRRKDRTCPTCSKVFDNLQARRAHETHAHAPRTQCPNCGKSFVGIARHRFVCDARHAVAKPAAQGDGPGEQVTEAAPTTPDPGGAAGARQPAARPDAVEAIMDLLTEVEELRALSLTDSATEVLALREEKALLTAELAEAHEEIEHLRKRVADADVVVARAEGTVAKMREAIGVRQYN